MHFDGSLVTTGGHPHPPPAPRPPVVGPEQLPDSLSSGFWMADELEYAKSVYQTEGTTRSQITILVNRVGNRVFPGPIRVSDLKKLLRVSTLYAVQITIHRQVMTILDDSSILTLVGGELFSTYLVD